MKTENKKLYYKCGTLEKKIMLSYYGKSQELQDFTRYLLSQLIAA